MSTQVVPYTKQPFHYATNSQYAWASNTTLSIAAGQYRDLTNTVDIVLSSAKTLNAATTGLNALDTGTLGASSWYRVYVIADSTGKLPAGTLLSLQASTPYLPYGYNVYALVGFALTDGSSHFVKFDVCGNGSERSFYFVESISVLSGGSSATYAAVDLSAAVPAVDQTEVFLNTAFTPNAANDIFKICKTAAAATAPLTIAGNVAGKVTQDQVTVVSGLASGVPKIDYLVTASGALTITVLGFKYYI